MPIEKKESIRWLENLRQSTDLLDDPGRCVHIDDRESDIYELFCAAQEIGTHFLIRTCVDRLAGDGDHTIADECSRSQSKGFIASRSETAGASWTRPFSRLGIAKFEFCHRLENGGDILR